MLQSALSEQEALDVVTILRLRGDIKGLRDKLEIAERGWSEARQKLLDNGIN